MKILFFGDVFGKPGREALRFIIPQWKKEYSPDIVIANGENVSHGAGISEKTIHELLVAGCDIITGGNHTFEGKNASALLDDTSLPLLRPANMPGEQPGRGYAFFQISDNGVKMTDDHAKADFAVINLLGQVHMRYDYESPFHLADTIIAAIEKAHPALPIIVDWHAEVSSEKIALGWYLDGRVSAILGTHTHTPTADERILPKGTGFISDVGMVGPHHSIIGQEIEKNLERFITQIPKKVDVAAAPPYEINAVFLEIEKRSAKTVRIQKIRKIIAENLA